MTAPKTKPRSTRRKPTGMAAALVESKKKDTVLLGDIQQHAVKRALEDSDRRQDIIHPSEMAKEDWCPRQTAWRIRGVEATDKGEVYGYHMLTVFQEGHDVHEKWQTWLGEMGRLWGLWRCRVCDQELLGLPGSLPDSEYHEYDDGFVDTHNHVWEYKEVPLDAETEWLIVGKADGAVPDVEVFIEVKTIGLGTLRMEEPTLVRKYTVETTDGKKVVDYDSLWKSIKHPLKTHRKQAAVYLAIARLNGWPYKRMVFIYENKANQQTKEFVVGYDKELADDLIDRAKDVKWAVETETDLPIPNGFRKDRKPCTQCVFRSRCYDSNDISGKAFDAISEEDSLQEGPRVHSREHSRDQGRVPRVSRMRSREAGEEGSSESDVQRRPRSNWRERPVRQSRSSSGVQDLRSERRSEVEREEQGLRPEVEVPEPVRNNRRGVRVVKRRVTKAVRDL